MNDVVNSGAGGAAVALAPVSAARFFASNARTRSSARRTLLSAWSRSACDFLPFAFVRSLASCA